MHFHAITGTTTNFFGVVVERRTPPISIREMDDGIAVTSRRSTIGSATSETEQERRDEEVCIRMMGLDTNLLVRSFAHDDEAQREAAARLIDDLPNGEKALVNIIVLAELLWTLGRHYKFERDELAAVVRRLSEHQKIELSERDVARDAAHRCRERGGEIVDHLIALSIAQAAATSHTPLTKKPRVNAISSC